MIRVYLFDRIITRGSSSYEYDQYAEVYQKWRPIYGDRVELNTDHSDHFQIWLNFDTEEEAVLFKLTHL